MSGAHARRRAGRAWRLVGWAVVVLAVLALTAFLTVGANGPEDPILGGIPGFGEVAFRVAPAGGGPPTSAEFCALLAADDTQRARGLMGRRDLAGFDAMVFRFDQDHTGAFIMRNVPVPLSIAWFDSSGAFVSSTDMPPCPDQEGCPEYAAAGPYRLAVETLQGGLEPLGLGPGSRMDVGGPCGG
ncbi:MAG: DUF192 domain-containing protein [Acidimicrobiales bacterium]